MIEWIHDPDKYIEWGLHLRRLVIFADDVLTAAKEGTGILVPAGTPVTAGIAETTNDPQVVTKAVVEAMQVAAQALRDLADHLDQAVETGIADWDLRPIANGPERPQ